MNSRSIFRLFIGLYMALFMAYMLLPMALMGAAAFNDSSIPVIAPWKGFTSRWFQELFQDRILWRAVLNSCIISAGVIALTLPLGLAAALLLTQMRSRARNLLYAVLVSPILTPGVIIGISTLIFWRALGVEGGLLLTVIGQATFITSFCMLLFISRLQRFDRNQEEAALDLGATPSQVFFRITLPFLRPTVLTALGISFLQSLENYNTTLFVIGAENTMTIRIASMVRLGLTPKINALGLVFIAVTIVLAVLFELKRRGEKQREEQRRAMARRAELMLVEQAQTT